MFSYHLRLALKSLRRTPVISGLMIGAIALGVGVCITTLTVYRLMSGNPIERRNDVLYAVTLDGWDPAEPINVKRPELPPNELTYMDAAALLQSDIPARRVAMRKAAVIVDRADERSVQPFQAVARLTTHDFFAMFDVPFLYGAAWDKGADDAAQSIIVLTQETNQKVFGGQDSVGQTVRLNGRDYKVVGVLADWAPAPKFYDLNNGAFDEPEQLFMPYAIGAALQLTTAGNTNCWGDKPLNSFQEFLNSECVWIQFWVELRNREQREDFQNFIDNYAREQKKLGRFQRPLKNKLLHPDEWLKLNRVVGDDNRVLVGLSFMFLAVCMLNMIGLLLAKFIGAAPLVGLRRALGASRATIFRQHLVEVGLIGIGGGLMGVLVAALGLLGVRQLYENYYELTRLDLTMGLISLAIALASGLLAGLYPTWRVCRVQPATYLKTQ